ncbi:MAG: MATE family efflux transporter [Lachnospiraceae bacterium]|nr:MATE family efflux transporter [Lachnospiraceae bacterium]
MDKKRLVINMTAQLLAFVVNLGISMVLTPIVDRMIPDSYGFLNIANNFVLWAQVVVSALNTLASRYITIHLHKGEEQEASEYFSSVFFANMFMAAVFLLPAIFLIVFINRIFQISPGIVTDIQILWAFVFLNFFISIITSVFSTSTYSTNRLELSSMATIVTELARLGVLYIAYRYFTPYLFYIGLASVISTTLMAAANAGFTRKLLPGIKITVKNFRLDKVKELVALGAWNSVTRLGQMLLDGLDTIIANIFISEAAMTTLSLAKVVPTTLSSLMGTMVGVFAPSITIAYAKGDKKELMDTLKSSNRIMIFMMSIPIAFVTAYGDKFFKLWLYYKDDPAEIRQIYYLSVLSMGVLFVSASIQVLYQVFIITKKIKLNSIVIVASGVITTTLVFVLLQTTDLGLYAIAGVSVVIGLIRNMVFTPIYAAKCLEVKWTTFYSDIFMGLASIGIITAVAMISKLFLPMDSWITFFASGIFMGCVALVLNFFIVLRKTERQMVLDKVMSKLKRS